MEAVAGLRKDGKFTSALTEEKIKVVLDAYEKYEGNEYLASRNLPYTRKTIRKYWKMYSLKNKIGRKKSKEKFIEKPLIEKSDTFLNTISDTKDWINKNIEDYKNKISSLKTEIENIDKVIEWKKEKRKKIENKINECEIDIVDCLECSIGILEITEDICKNREKAEFYNDYRCTYKLNK